jgi:hypothetical protein
MHFTRTQCSQKLHIQMGLPVQVMVSRVKEQEWKGIIKNKQINSQPAY